MKSTTIKAEVKKFQHSNSKPVWHKKVANKNYHLKKMFWDITDTTEIRKSDLKHLFQGNVYCYWCIDTLKRDISKNFYSFFYVNLY